jgi:MoaD family protein
MIKLRLFAGLRDAVGEKEVKMEESDITLKELLQKFAASRGEKVRDFLFDSEGNVWRSVMLLINDEPADRELQTKVKSGDVVSILLPTAGG